MTDYKDIINNYHNHNCSKDFVMGYLQCLYVNQLIRLDELHELNYYVVELYK